MWRVWMPNGHGHYRSPTNLEVKGLNANWTRPLSFPDQSRSKGSECQVDTAHYRFPDQSVDAQTNLDSTYQDIIHSNVSEIVWVVCLIRLSWILLVIANVRGTCRQYKYGNYRIRLWTKKLSTYFLYQYGRMLVANAMKLCAKMQI